MMKNIFWIVIGLTALFYLFTHFGVLLSGDSVENIRQIEQYDILSRSSHFTFHFFGVLFYILFKFLFNTTSVFSVELMLMTFSVFGTISLYKIVELLFKDDYLAAITTLVYAVSSGIWRFSVQAEYLVLVPSLALITMNFYLREKIIFAGLSFALGLMASPFIVLVSPFFLFNFERKYWYYKELLIFILVTILIYASVNLFTAHETAYGRWSLTTSLYRFIETSKVGHGIGVLVYGFIRSFHILIIPGIIGAKILHNKNPKLFWISISILVLHLPTTLSEYRQGAYIFGFYPFLALCIGFWLRDQTFNKKRLSFSFLFLYIVLNFVIVRAEQVHFQKVVETYQELNQSSTIPDSSIFFVYPSSKPFNYYRTRSSLKGLTVESFIPSEFAGPLSIEPIVNSGKPLFLIESGLREPDDFIKRLLPASILRSNDFGYSEHGKTILTKLMSNKKFNFIQGFPVTVYKIE